jgi:DNA-binding CsgD family transcriptional regulator
MTSREREVIELIAEGLSNKQIATRLNLAVDTVKSHVHNILEKLQLHTRLEIASYRHAGGPVHVAGAWRLPCGRLTSARFLTARYRRLSFSRPAPEVSPPKGPPRFPTQ